MQEHRGHSRRDDNKAADTGRPSAVHSQQAATPLPTQSNEKQSRENDLESPIILFNLNNISKMLEGNVKLKKHEISSCQCRRRPCPPKSS